MRSSPWKVLLPIALLSVIGFAGSTLLGQGASKRGAASPIGPVTRQLPNRQLGTRVGEIRELKIDENAKDGPQLVAITDAQLERFNATPFVGGLEISATVKLKDSRPNARYLWNLRVKLAGGDRVVFEEYYQDQIFKIGDVVAGGPAFQETVKLSPGAYEVRVALVCLPEGMDPAAPRDEATEAHLRVVSAISKAVVPSFP